MPRPRPLLLPELALWAALALGCESGEPSDGDGGAGAESTGTGAQCQDSDDCENGTCHPQEHVCVDDTCDPTTEEIGPEPRDQPGDPCCTQKPGCTGYDRMGDPINPLYVGDTLLCVGGEWVEDPAYCEGSCDAGTTLLGCVWDSTQGSFVKPQCVCQKP